MATKIEIAESLAAENPEFVKRVDLLVFAGALKMYVEASANVDKNGAICAHPRTGQPIENPFLAVQERAARVMARMRRIKSDRTVEIYGAGARTGKSGD